MRRMLRRLAELSFYEWLLLPQCVVASIGLACALRFTSLNRLAGLTARYASSSRGRHLPLFHRQCRLDRLLWLASRAASVLHGDGCCLLRSLLFFWLLHARRKPAHLLLGVSKQADRLQGHAWVESAGLVMGHDSLYNLYTPVLRF